MQKFTLSRSQKYKIYKNPHIYKYKYNICKYSILYFISYIYSIPINRKTISNILDKFIISYQNEKYNVMIVIVTN